MGDVNVALGEAIKTEEERRKRELQRLANLSPVPKKERRALNLTEALILLDCLEKGNAELRSELGKYHSRIGTLQDREAALRRQFADYAGCVGMARAEEVKAQQRAARCTDFLIQARSAVRDVLYALGNRPMDAQWQAAKDACSKMLQESAEFFPLEETE